MSAVFFCRQHSVLAHIENLPKCSRTVLNQLFFPFLETKAVVWNNIGGNCNRQYSTPLTDLSAPVYSLTTRSTFWKTNQKLIVNRSLPSLYLFLLSVLALNLALRYPCCLSKPLFFFSCSFTLLLKVLFWKMPWNISELLHFGATMEKNILIILHIRCWLSELRWWLLELPLARVSLMAVSICKVVFFLQMHGNSWLKESMSATFF